jgi:uncharacterized protein with HXXEE motif
MEIKISQSHTSSSFWIWVFPITFLIHITEEYFGGEGYSGYLLRLRGIALSPQRFLVGQAIAFAFMVAGIILAKHFKFLNHMIVIMGAVVLINALTHGVQSVAHGQYVPGLVTAIILWLPLGMITLLRFKSQIRTSRYWICVTLGVAIISAVEILIISS